MSKRALASITRDGIVIHENCFDRIQDIEISRLHKLTAHAPWRNVAAHDIGLLVARK
ncbi:MAG: hypothetical protein VCB82_12915 [Alphaproteobacteria bacterium]